MRSMGSKYGVYENKTETVVAYEWDVCIKNDNELSRVWKIIEAAHLEDIDETDLHRAVDLRDFLTDYYAKEPEEYVAIIKKTATFKVESEIFTYRV